MECSRCLVNNTRAVTWNRILLQSLVQSFYGISKPFKSIKLVESLEIGHLVVNAVNNNLSRSEIQNTNI